jgi:hypothetical protein
MMEAPEQEGDAEYQCGGGPGLPPEAEEDAGGPEGGAAQECDRRKRGVQELVGAGEVVDREQRPDGRKEYGEQIGPLESRAAGEDQRAPQERQRGPAGDDLVCEEPEGAPGLQEDDDRAQSTEVERPGDGPPEEIGLAVAAVEQGTEAGDPEGDRGLQQRRMQLGRRVQRVCPSQRATRSRYPRLTFSRVPSCRMAMNSPENHGCSSRRRSTFTTVVR